MPKRTDYENGGWYSLDGRRLALEEALEFKGDCRIHFRNEPIIFRGVGQRNMLKFYPPSLWAHGGKRVTGC